MSTKWTIKLGIDIAIITPSARIKHPAIGHLLDISLF